MIDASTRINDGVCLPFASPDPRLIGVVARTQDVKPFACSSTDNAPSQRSTLGFRRRVPFLIPSGGRARSAGEPLGSRVVSMDKSGSVMLWWPTRSVDSSPRPQPRQTRAYGFLHDLDVTNTLDDLEALGEAMLMRLEYEKPWESVPVWVPALDSRTCVRV